MKHLFSALVLLVSFPLWAAPSEVGIVLLHGKWGHPNAMGNLAKELEIKGYKVVVPMMPWAGTRNYDVDYPQALSELDEQVAQLKAMGAKHIVVGGQSMGANAALAYAATRKTIQGVMAIAPGHVPDQERFFKPLAADFAKAQALVAQGRGAESAWFDDNNQGQVKAVKTTASSYVSYLSPDGLANMPRSVSLLPTTTPLLIVLGHQDGLMALGEGYLFNKAPKNAKNRYAVISSGHMNTSANAVPVVIQWLEALIQ